MITAQENLVSLAEILKKFPDIQKNDLYLAGEEYAGIFVPELAKKVEEWNANCAVSKDCAVEPNLKGFIVGNGFTDSKYDKFDNAVDMAYWFGLIDLKLFELLKIDGCTFMIPTDDQTAPCQRYLNEFIDALMGINPFDGYKTCKAVSGA